MHTIDQVMGKPQEAENDGTPAVIAVVALHKSFGSQEVLNGISLSVGRGKTLAVLGRSGTGKSVLLRPPSCAVPTILTFASRISVMSEFKPIVGFEFEFTAGKGENSILADDLISTPRQLNPMLPETLSNFVMECTRINPAKRPTDMAEVIRRLEIIQHACAKQSPGLTANVA